MCTCSLVAVGHELLDGRVTDTNSEYISEKLASLGIKVTLRVIVGDVIGELRDTLSWAMRMSDMVIVTGGLGPTGDDITREAAAEAFGLSLRSDPEIEDAIRAIFEKMGREMPISNLRQAQLIEGAAAIHARMGTAPGQVLEHKGKTIVFLPGVPREMRDMMENDVLPRLRESIPRGRTKEHVTLYTAAKPESEVAEMVSPVLSEYEGITVSYRARPGQIEVRLEAWDDDDRMIARAAESARKALGSWLVAEGDETLEGNLGNELRFRGLTLAVAESCTGGLLGERITRIPGSSDYFKGGVVAYSYEAKERLLKVDRELLEGKGSVCEEVAGAMARGAKELFSSDIGIAVTCVAGPGSGREKESVGNVAFGLAGPDGVQSWRFTLPGNREMIREVAATALLAITYFYVRDGGEVMIPE